MTYLNYGVQKTSYYYTGYGELLESDNYVLHGSNIGLNGENLTITFLSLNRSELSIRLLTSIENCLIGFKGEVLIVDNGSLSTELDQIEAFCAKCSFKYRIVSLGENYGVAGGRNKTLSHVATEWVLCLDNDIYFLNNPIAQICKEISMLGCHFMNIPLLDPDQERVFALGGHLYVDSTNGEINVGGGSCYKQGNYKEYEQNLNAPFLSNFLFGGASLLKKETFLRLGGYDEKMFIGFEDTDLSIRIFREGYKIGNTCSLSLVHDHPKPVEQTDIEYEKKRFSVNIIQQSAKHLEDKYGYKIWDSNLVKWLEEKNKGLGETVSLSTPTNVVTNPLPKIALITDVDYWAFGNIARQIEKNLSDRYEIKLISFEDCNWDPVKLLFRAADCDILHFFWREMIAIVSNENSYYEYLKPLNISPNEFLDKYFYKKILSTSVYDHLFLETEEIEKRENLFNTFNYYVSSEKLDRIYKSIPLYPEPVMVIEDGIDEKLFYPKNLKRFDIKKRPLIIGWVGNSKWAAEEMDFKGFATIVKPVIEELKNEGYLIDAQYCDRVDGFVPHEQMVHYYEKIDVLVCMSLIEGTPNPVLEAMACGVPVISTDVGIVPQVFGVKQNKYIIDRTKKALKETLISLEKNRNELVEMSNENLHLIKKWYWTNQCKKFDSYFSLLQLKNKPKGENK
ncbi:group 1 glycosyl transferase [Paenibacillus sp. FSL R7-269]|uniref:glycosyltransferase n=1 Tax=Paenibacillus sp. FSL R7-269 TaxID=1226755 RepID=UPI0003E2C6C1|nr:glycosyltransferase [Paenibacillus sp. FSL R7-269]ETT50046.1 group 1 glycosyl transferase [Paenibacillus sp. FSL R7-269]